MNGLVCVILFYVLYICIISMQSNNRKMAEQNIIDIVVEKLNKYPDIKFEKKIVVNLKYSAVTKKNLIFY